MTGYENPASGDETPRWQYGERVQDRAPERTSGAFYGVVSGDGGRA